MVVVTPSTTEAINFKAPTAAQGGNLNAIRPHPSPSVSPRSQEAEPFTGDVGLHADHTLAYPLAIGFTPRVNDFNIYVVNSADVQNYGLTVAIISAVFSAWNFSVDTVTVTPATAAPEPLSPSLFSTGFLLAVVLRRKRLPSEPQAQQAHT
jgi:hypothetical protein